MMAGNDGWHLIAELDEAGEVTRYFVWGLDLSQTLQGAGGVGGLICSVDSTNEGSSTYHFFYDSNGNIGQLINEEHIEISYYYDFFPFGNNVYQNASPMCQDSCHMNHNDL